MITLSSSLQQLLSAAAVTPRTLVDLTTQWGVYHWSTDAFRWSGIDYQPMLLADPEVITELGGPGLVVPKSLSLEFANADGWFSQREPEFFRDGRMTIRQCLLEVNSEAIYTLRLTTTGGEMLDATRYRLSAEDALATARRQLVPNASMVITTSLYPRIPADSPGLGRIIPVTEGFQTFTPMYLVEEASTKETGAGAIFISAQGAPPIGAVGGGGAIVQVFNGELLAVSSAQYRVEGLPDGNFIRMVYQASSPRLGGVGELLPHYATPASLRGGLPIAGMCDLVLIGMLTNSAMAGLDGPTLVDSDSFTAAQSFWTGLQGGGYALSAAFIEQRPFEEYLDQWCYDSMAHLTFRDRLRISLQNSRAPVATFYAGNIVAGSFLMRDLPVSGRGTTQELLFELGAHTEFDDTGFYDVAPRSLARYQAGTGASEQRTSPFISSRVQADFVTKMWALREQYGSREYRFTTGLQGANLEETDLITLTHSLLAGPKTCEVTGLRRKGGIVQLTCREFSNAAFVNPGGQLDTLGGGTVPGGAFVAYDATTRWLGVGSAQTITSSHGRDRVPFGVTPIWLNHLANIRTLSRMTTANNSEFTLVISATDTFNLREALNAFLVRL